VADAARWHGLYICVNLSPIQVRNRTLVDLVNTVLKETEFEPSRLVLEMTESVLIENPDEITARLRELRALGVKLALDDFGSGYSSLGYLQKLPFDKLKIDRSFVLGLNESANGGVIIQAIVTLGRALGMGVVIEGVETEEQRVLLRLAGCSEMQGYLFARPAAAADIDRLIEAQRSSAHVAPTPLRRNSRG
jgi:EAL domain-containing protein (putative c-di-GMP-specific phosphodiesterase class I)